MAVPAQRPKKRFTKENIQRQILRRAVSVKAHSLLGPILLPSHHICCTSGQLQGPPHGRTLGVTIGGRVLAAACLCLDMTLVRSIKPPLLLHLSWNPMALLQQATRGNRGKKRQSLRKFNRLIPCIEARKLSSFYHIFSSRKSQVQHDITGPQPRNLTKNYRVAISIAATESDRQDAPSHMPRIKISH